MLKDLPQFLDRMWEPLTHQRLEIMGGNLSCPDTKKSFPIVHNRIVCFIDDEPLSMEAARQQRHYDKIYQNYTQALRLPHSEEYGRYMDRKLLQAIGGDDLGDIAELCCGTGEAFKLLGTNYRHGYGIDISRKMLEMAGQIHADKNVLFMHADALHCPLKDQSMDHIIMLGGIHHINDRQKLFAEIFRILKPGGRFIFREPASDWIIWRAIRKLIYRISPGLDYKTERPLRFHETVPILEQAGFQDIIYANYTFIGFCLFMNADILIFNRLFKYIPFIRSVARGFAQADDVVLRLPCMKRLGLQVIGVAKKI